MALPDAPHLFLKPKVFLTKKSTSDTTDNQIIHIKNSSYVILQEAVPKHELPDWMESLIP